jgi:hypothetical protein
MVNNPNYRQPEEKTTYRRLFSAVVVLSAFFVVVALCLPHDSDLRPLRITLALIGVAIAPGWALSRRSNESAALLVQLASSALVSCSLYVVLDFAGDQMDLRLTPVEYVVPSLVAGLVAMLVLSGASHRTQSSASSVVLAVVLVIVSLGSAIAIHDLLPTPTPEASFSLSAPTAIYSDNTLSIAGMYVPSQRPHAITLTVQVDYLTAQSVTLPRHKESFTIDVRAPHTVKCDNLTVQIGTSSGQYLSPRIICPK